MSFIQAQQSLVTRRKTLRLARLLSLDRYTVVGRLVALWSWSLGNALDGRLGADIDADVLADVMDWEANLGKPAELLEGLLTAGVPGGACGHDQVAAGQSHIAAGERVGM